MFAVLSALLFAVQAEPAPPPAPVATPAAEPELTIEVEGREGRQRLFVAPSGEPFRAYRGEPDPKLTWFRQADADGNGFLGYEEFEADFLRFVDALDTDGNGEIGFPERMYYETDIVPETRSGAWEGGIEGDPEREAPGQGVGSDASGTGSLINADPRRRAYREVPIGAGRFDLLGLPEPVAAMDARVRGRITKDDAKVSANLRFSLLDTADRGYLTFEDLPKR